MMAIITTAALLIGVTAFSIGGSIWHAATERDRIQAQIQQLEAEITSLNEAKKYVENVSTKLNNTKEYLISARKSFGDGGHVYEGEPLANSEFTSCIHNIDEAIGSASNMMRDFDDTIAYNKAEINKLKNKLN